MKIPERSMFYGLHLSGGGTGDVESLRSYLQRLACEHHVKSSTVLRMLFGEKSRVKWSELLLHGRHSKKYIERVEDATGVHLSAASMARFASVLPENAFVRRVQVHCLHCAREPNRYGRLLWELTAVAACPEHGVRLVRRSCGDPQKEKLRIANRPNLTGVCSVCGSIGFLCNSQPPPASRDEVWVAEQARDLLALTDSEVVSLRPELLRKGISAAVEQVFDGAVVVASRKALLGRTTVLNWVRGPSRPALSTLLQFALAAEASVVSLFRGHFVRCARSSSEAIAAIREHAYVRHDWRAVEKGLSAALTAEHVPTVAAVSRSLGVDASLLRRRYPVEIRKLYLQSACRRETERSRSREEFFMTYSAVARSLISDGYEVTRKNLERRSGLPTFGESGARFEALLAVLQEFGSREAVVVSAMEPGPAEAA